MLSAHSQLTLLSQHAAEGQDLTAQEIEQAIHDLLNPDISIEVKAEFLLCLSRKGETPREVADFAILLRELAVDPHVDLNLLGGNLIDTCGTGADGVNTFNVSTAVTFILAAADIPVAKHGNRAVTSQCGSADVLEALNIDIQMPPAKTLEGLYSLKIGFFFAPQYHKTFKLIKPVREFLAQKGNRTIFNLLGPLLNPAKPNIQIIGVYDPTLTDLYIQALYLMKLKRALVVHGYDQNKNPCMDELSTLGISKISQLHSNGNVESLEIDSSSFHLQRATLEDLKGGDPQNNASLIENLLLGKDKSLRRDFLLYNASLGFVLAGKASDLEGGLKIGKEILESGAAFTKLEAFRKFSKSG